MTVKLVDFPLSPKGALFNADRTRRYLLWRRIDALWEGLEPSVDDSRDFILFIGLNPSIADENRLDPTVTRCYNYAKRWGFAHLLMGNLYSRVSTDPNGVDFNDDSGESENWNHLASAVQLANVVIVCWGSNANPKIAARWLYLQTKTLYALGKNKNGSPKHPLYLRADVLPKVYIASAASRFKAGEWE